MFLRNYDWVKRVCILESAYSLLIYFLISSEEEIKTTFFFWGKGVPEHIRNYFKGRSYSWEDSSINLKDNIFIILYYAAVYKLTFLKWPFLKKNNITYWGADHLLKTPFIVHDNKINVIEDGTLNYFPQRKRNLPKSLISFTTKMIDGFEYSFKEDWCAREYITDLIPNSEASRSSKSVVVSLMDLWKKSSTKKKQLILDIYGLKDSDIECLEKSRNILLTQPLSEDYTLTGMTEVEKIELYKSLIAKCNIKDFIIKPHPRETTDYTKYFPKEQVFTKKIPIEMFQLLGINFDNVYTLNSSAAYNISKYSNANVVMWKEYFPKFKYPHRETRMDKAYYWLIWLPWYELKKHILHKL